MVQVIEQSDRFGKIGKAFGEGAAGQIERGRVANALTPEKGKPFNPLDTTQRLIRAGASPQEISNYLPLLQQEQSRAEFGGSQAANGNVSPGSQPIGREAAQVNRDGLRGTKDHRSQPRPVRGPG